MRRFDSRRNKNKGGTYRVMPGDAFVVLSEISLWSSKNVLNLSIEIISNCRRRVGGWQIGYCWLRRGRGKPQICGYVIYERPLKNYSKTFPKYPKIKAKMVKFQSAIIGRRTNWTTNNYIKVINPLFGLRSFAFSPGYSC